MSKNQIAFQGKKGAYSYIACQQLYPNLKTVECHSFRDVFNKVESGDVKFGLVPVENSTAGRVADVHNLLRDINIHIIREFFMPINHCLLAPQGATLKTIKRVYSHIQALTQCEQNMLKYGFVQQEKNDTAGAAQWVALEKNIQNAAISSEISAQEYGLSILLKNYQDSAYNTTRFIVLSKDSLSHSYDKGSYITTLIFRVKNTPAALYKVLGGFATNNVNVLKLESYLCDGGFKSAEFCMDVEAHIDEKCMKKSMEELEFFVKSKKVLGCYPAHKFRRNI